MSCIPRVLSVAPLKPGFQKGVGSGLLATYSTRPKRGPIEASEEMQVSPYAVCIPRVLSVAPLKQRSLQLTADTTPVFHAS